MGISLSTARVLAPASFVLDFAAQTYGLLSTPNMKDIHDTHLSFFSPQPFFIGAFFFPQQIFQLVWLWRLHNAKSDDSVTPTMVDFAPFYALGNICIASWMLFWNGGDLKTSNVFVAINTFAQLYFIASRLPRMDTASTNSILTHVVSKTFAGIGVLDLLHNTSAAYFIDAQPSVPVKILTGVGFGLVSALSDWIFGGCLVYDLIALSVGQSIYGNSSWSKLLGVYAGGTAVIVGAKNLLR
ncbi:hypothetical protein ACHAQA_005701 [Verticillium albo-atrum]